MEMSRVWGHVEPQVQRQTSKCLGGGQPAYQININHTISNRY